MYAPARGQRRGRGDRQSLWIRLFRSGRFVQTSNSGV